MTTSQTGIDLITSFEGCKLTAYKDPTGVWTIGYGHTSGVKQGMSISLAQAQDYLKQDLQTAEKYVNALPFDLNQNQFDALVSFTYNCGSGNLSKLTANRDLEAIGNALELYNKGGGVVLAGLVRRRAAEKELFFKAPEEFPGDFYRETNTLLPLDEVLFKVGAFPDYDWTKLTMYKRRMPIALANGIKDYTGTTTQNETLKALAEAGRLKRVQK